MFLFLIWKKQQNVKTNSTEAIMTSEHISFVPQFDYTAMKRVMERHHKVARLKISLHWDWQLRC